MARSSESRGRLKTASLLGKEPQVRLEKRWRMAVLWPSTPAMYLPRPGVNVKVLKTIVITIGMKKMLGGGGGGEREGRWRRRERRENILS